METLNTLERILENPKIVIPKTEKQQSIITETAQSIFEHENTSRGRSLDDIFLSSEALAVEMWLEENTSFKRNPLEFDKTNPESYAYDLINEEGQTMEVKTCIDPAHKYWNIYSWAYISTMMKNLDRINFIFLAGFHRRPNSYIIEPKMIIESSALEGNVKRSKWNGYYFDHRSVRNKMRWNGKIA